MAPRRGRGLAVIVVGFILGCAGDEPGRCRADRECGAEAACRSGRCVCLGDGACGPEERCNAAGSCQARPPCRSNRDCGPGERCDAATGRCGPDDRCPRDLHCPIGSVCEDRACVPGCRVDADCPLGQICQAPDAPGLGRCEVGCRDTEGCPLASLCLGERCFDQPLPGLCAPCGRAEDCGGAGDWCVENRGHDPARPETGAARHCAADCDGAPEVCPNGYVCRAIVARVTLPCTTDRECGLGRRCRIDEGDPVGACTCANDADCHRRLAPRCALGFCEAPAGRLCRDASDCEAVDACGPYGPGGRDACYLDPTRPCADALDCRCLGGTCVLSGRPCRDARDCPVRCEGGGCAVGAGCVPDEGLFCPALRSGG